ncbi:thioredoxin, putative [Eimeria acervulina]|uniref:Thioredoxin n=1 Tax=Eimeria acervulina TaxID=5801 RepID=U6GVI2_EIMAC|nr:thioredoxin, putative [Eimeria acervulina]CDI84271.1 thioredoxin, putative [Eimeria acervulina]
MQILWFCLAEFDEVTKSGLVVVDFFATWCGPCKMIKPFLEEKSNSMTHITFCAVDVDENPELCEREEVQAMPTFKLYKDGKTVQTIVGVRKTELEQAIENLK